jgi:pimeloyl-ACP methyl ester carboxylesterase
MLSSASLVQIQSATGHDSGPRVFNSNGVPIQYTIDGRGEPVVLIHGLFASARINWRAPGMIKTLAKDYQVIALDVRGHGGSGKPKEEEAYGVEMMQDVVRLLDHLKIQKAHVVGYSMGGMITMKLLTRHPDRVRSAILGGMGWLRQGGPLQQSWTQVPGRVRAAVPAACVRSLSALAVTEDELKAIRIPVTVLIGELDSCRPLYVAPLQKVRADWPITLIPEADHLNCIFQPGFEKGIKDWLDPHTP